MSLFGRIFREEGRSSAEVAKNRLSLLITHERKGGYTPDFLPALQKEILAVISRYVDVSPEDIKVELDRHENLEVLEVSIILPDLPR
jgi:cell division topological specificity factor